MLFRVKTSVCFVLLSCVLSGCHEPNEELAQPTGAVRVGQVLGASEDDALFDRASELRTLHPRRSRCASEKH